MILQNHLLPSSIPTTCFNGHGCHNTGMRTKDEKNDIHYHHRHESKLCHHQQLKHKHTLIEKSLHCSASSLDNHPGQKGLVVENKGSGGFWWDKEGGREREEWWLGMAMVGWGWGGDDMEVLVLVFI